jgi:transposase-like protein
MVDSKNNKNCNHKEEYIFMGRKSKFSAEEKQRYILEFIEGKDSIHHAASLIGINAAKI